MRASALNLLRGDIMNQKERVEEFKVQAGRSLQMRLDESKIDFSITAGELLEITEEDALEFLSRDPKNGNFNPLLYSQEVYENFINNLTYYFDKLIRPTA